VIDVSELMSDPDFVRAFSIMRPTLTVANEGVASSTYATTQLTGIVQPASDNELKLLPEGSRLSDVIAVWSHSEIRAGDGSTIESDVILVDGKRYRVIKADPWPDAGYYKVLAEGYVS